MSTVSGLDPSTGSGRRRLDQPERLVHEADELLLGFTRALRASGVPVTMDRAQAFLAATAVVGLGDRKATYWAGRATLCGCPDDLDRYDQVFTAWFLGDDQPTGRKPSEPRPPQTRAALDDEGGTGDGDPADDDPLRARASDVEVLRHRDIGDMNANDRARLALLFDLLRPRAPRRRAHRRQAWHRGDVDAGRTMRRSLQRMGEPAEIAWRRRATKPRRVVLLVDVSGSMSPYADALLRLAHRFVTTTGATTEVFTVGTRLTRVTRAMRLRNPDQAIVAAGRTVPDWSGGTRLGETLRIFLDRWGQRGLARGAVVVVFSDGWERGDTALLAAQMRRLHDLAHAVVWVNPHVGRPGYQPVQQGIVAALDHVDHFVAGHSLAAFAELIEVVADA
ncbi:vWA domain-containing protein [Nocardioides iriomotensis]|uniref:VWA domain-containing protein n=1 Tax=Nocardioides iriomotensis TaxID=715784 RepID=A0A4Q5J6W3_9ACTN|nr:VWA domain-containing protein [Nocardioides iriomotensis]RYU13451.1 VWA domain-containing protein [Nocardioides iriomotensis]